jgi:hypothetical protein
MNAHDRRDLNHKIVLRFWEYALSARHLDIEAKCSERRNRNLR